MRAKQIASNLDLFIDYAGGLDVLKEFFFSSSFNGNLTLDEDSKDSDALFLDLKKSGSNFDANKVMSAIDLSGIWEGFLLYDLPKSWKWMRLDQVGTIVGGGTPDTSNGAYWAKDSGTPWITPADMRHQGMYVLGGKRSITEIGLKESSSKLLPTNSVVFSSRAPIGYVGITGVPLATNQGFKSCAPFRPEMTKFIYFYLMFISAEINRRASGTTFKEISGKQFAATPIPVPPLRTQQSIVNKIEEFLELSSQAEDKVAHRERLARSARKSAVDAISTAQTLKDLQTAWERIHQNWGVMVGTAEGISDLRTLIETLGIRGQLTEKLESAETAEDLLKSLDLDAGVSIKEDSEFVPRNWVMTNLGSIIKLEYGKSLPKQSRSPLGKVPVYGSNGVVGYHDAALIESDAIVVGRKGSIGQVNIANGKSWVIDTAYYVTPQANMALDYVALLIKTCKLETLNKATAIPGLNRNDAYAQRCYLAPPEEQNRIMQTVNALLDICNRLESALQERDKLALKFSRSVVSASA
jgi:type I restriction enzyme S subunit